MSKQDKRNLIVFGFVAAVLLLIAAVFDLPIDRAIYSPTNLFGIIMEGFCYWPIYLPFALFGASTACLYHDDTLKRAVGTVCTAGCFYGLSLYALKSFSKRGLPASTAVCAMLAILPAIVLTVLAFIQAGKTSRGDLIRAEFMGRFGILFCVCEAVVVYALKTLWTRMRYDDMAAADDFSSFTPWYRFGAVRGNSSFPSGHVAAACGILLLLLLPVLFTKWSGKKTQLRIVCLVYVAVTAFSRMLVGRHFLSDTVAASVIMVLIFVLLTRSDWYRKALPYALYRAKKADREAAAARKQAAE